MPTEKPAVAAAEPLPEWERELLQGAEAKAEDAEKDAAAPAAPAAEQPAAEAQAEAEPAAGQDTPAEQG